jgi:hypothetical protein
MQKDHCLSLNDTWQEQELLLESDTIPGEHKQNETKGNHLESEISYQVRVDISLKTQK